MLETIETLPSGSQVKKLEGYKEPRTFKDLPPVRLHRATIKAEHDGFFFWVSVKHIDIDAYQL